MSLAYSCPPSAFTIVRPILRCRRSGTHRESQAERVSHGRTERIQHRWLRLAQILGSIFTETCPEARHTHEAAQPRLASEAKANTPASGERRLGKGSGIQVHSERGGFE